MTDEIPNHNSTLADLDRGSPFEEQARVMFDPTASHDDVSRVQTRADMAAEVSGEHVQSLLYEPGYIFDPRSSPRGALYYPGPASGETEAEQR